LQDTKSQIAVEMKNIYKTFEINGLALENASLKVKKGTVHALLGENGAGKTTMMNILYGLCGKDAGEIYINGEKVEIKNPHDAISFGIGMVHQHFKLVENFTVAQNIMLGEEQTNKFGILDLNKIKEKINLLIEKYGLKVDLDAKIEDISVGMQQRVEILKMLYRGAEFLILDEPTAVLTPQETDDLIKIMKKLSESGKTIIIITHKLKEIKNSAEYCTIIRKGKDIDTVLVKDTSENTLASKMVGREVNLKVYKEKANFGEVVFSVENLTIEDDRNKGKNLLKDLSFEIHKGEIFGIAGVDGNGQKELVEAIVGLRKIHTGKIKINKKEIQNKKTREIIKNKIAIIHEDRQKRSIILDMTVAENAVLEKYRDSEFSSKKFLNYKNINKFTKSIIYEYDINPKNSEKMAIKSLSGGNQQKLVIGREIAKEPDLLIAVQPTRGLDVGAIEYVHKILVQERDKGKAILLISLELDEILNLSDTLAVIYNGEITRKFKAGEVSEKTVGLLMAGGKI